MAIDKVVDSARLDGAIGATAEKIREKTGASAKIAWDEEKGFADAVGAIQAGGGGEDLLAASLGDALENYHSDDVKKVSSYAFYQRKKLKSVSLPNVTDIGTNCFNGCSALESISIPKMSGLNGSMFYDCGKLTELTLPLGTWFNGACMGGTGLVSIDLGSNEMTATSGYISNSAFSWSTKIQALILRHPFVMTLQNVGAFNNSNLGGHGETYSGHIYVPESLIDSYRTAANWSTLYTNYPEIFRTIEGSEYE